MPSWQGPRSLIPTKAQVHGDSEQASPALLETPLFCYKGMVLQSTSWLHRPPGRVPRERAYLRATVNQTVGKFGRAERTTIRLTAGASAHVRGVFHLGTERDANHFYFPQPNCRKPNHSCCFWNKSACESLIKSSRSVPFGEPFDRLRTEATHGLTRNAERMTSRRFSFLRVFRGVFATPTSTHDSLVRQRSYGCPRETATVPLGCPNSRVGTLRLSGSEIPAG
jgi:hypothetical protein